MRSDVLRVVLFGEEVLFAIITAMLFDLQVDTFPMINQRRVGLEGRTTFGAQETFDIFVDRDFVDSQR